MLTTPDVQFFPSKWLMNRQGRTYYLTVTRPTTGTYAFQIHDFNAGPVIALGDDVSGTATPPSQAIIRHFSASDGRRAHGCRR